MKLAVPLAITIGISSGIASSIVTARVGESRRRNELEAAKAAATAPKTVETSRPATEKREELMTKHWQEPVDEAWATLAAHDFRSDLETIDRQMREHDAGLDVNILVLSCRTSSCVAELGFRDYQEETTVSLKYVTWMYAQKYCTRTIFDPTPASFDAPYTATLYFDCSRRPSDGAQAQRP